MHASNGSLSKKMLRSLALTLALTLVLGLLLLSSGCGDSPESTESTDSTDSQPVELVVFAAASMTETLKQISDLYAEAAPHVTLVYNFESSGTLKTQIEEGAACDLFISAAQKQMDQLDIAADAAVNTDGLDFILSETRVNLLENSVVLIVPEGTDSHIAEFSDVAGDQVSLIALGNSDVPVGQYSAEIFTSMGIWDQLNKDQRITFGSNVKEVLAQVAEASVDCGVVYGTDAATAKGIEVVAAAPADSHGPIVYPAAVLNTSSKQGEAANFLDFLQTEECSKIFESAGFTLPEEE